MERDGKKVRVGRRLWRPCRSYRGSPDPKKPKTCMRCGRTEAAHRAESLPADAPWLMEQARLHAKMSVPEWDAADDELRARCYVLWQESVIRDAWAREAAVSEENGIGPARVDAGWSQRAG